MSVSRNDDTVNLGQWHGQVIAIGMLVWDCTTWVGQTWCFGRVCARPGLAFATPLT